MTSDTISRLLDRYVELAETPRNVRLLQETWLRPGLAYLGDIGVPEPGRVPIIAVPHLSMWARKMGISVAKLFQDPPTYLEVFVSREIGRFMQIKDDRPIQKKVPVALGCGFESTLFGANQQYSDLEDPWVDRAPVLQNLEDQQKLEIPDFYKSGLMPLAHRFYRELQELVEGYDLEIEFPKWSRSPFGIAVQLRGLESLMIDMIEKPYLFTRLLEFTNHCAIHYQKERNAFLTGNPEAPYKPVFHNDEVNVPCISPQHYHDLVLPCEKVYADTFGGLTYWHSCGDVTPMIPAIQEIRNITIFHVGPWTDLAKAAEVFGDVTLDVCLDSMDIYQASEADMRAKITDIVRTCRQCNAQSFSIRPGILQAFSSINEDLASVARWVEVAKETLKKLDS